VQLIPIESEDEFRRASIVEVLNERVQSFEKPTSQRRPNRYDDPIDRRGDLGSAYLSEGREIVLDRFDELRHQHGGRLDLGPSCGDTHSQVISRQSRAAQL
jgi:hypothetical protein